MHCMPLQTLVNMTEIIREITEPDPVPSKKELFPFSHKSKWERMGRKEPIYEDGAVQDGKSLP